MSDKRVIAINRVGLFFVLIFIFYLPYNLFGQSNSYWSRSFNEESSLLSGAVVGGGAGPSAIYYNPSSISEITESKFSLHASLFSFDFINIKNALGDGIDLSSSRGKIEPRFISYMLKPKKNQDWSFEFAFLNNENYKQEFSQSVDEETDIMSNIPGNERYFALFQYGNVYRDDWFGIGGSWKINHNLFIGASMFLAIKQIEYFKSLDIEVFPLDSVFIDGDYVPFYSSSFQETESLKYNDYRLLWKLGILYRRKHVSFGISITSPSIGGIYSDGKRVSRKLKQTNISNPETGEPIPDFVVIDYKEKKDVSVDNKSPLSIAAGVTFRLIDTTRVVFTTVEYFGGLDPYRLVEANESPGITGGTINQHIAYSEWLTFVNGAKPVFNAAIGYQWYIKKDLMMMAGFRTDFNFRKNLNYSPFVESKEVLGNELDVYHITGGLSWRVKGQNLITGLQYTIGNARNQQQIANLSDPVEYNDENYLALQGRRENTMNSLFNSISIYFGATFNFGGDTKKK